MLGHCRIFKDDLGKGLFAFCLCTPVWLYNFKMEIYSHLQILIGIHSKTWKILQDRANQYDPCNVSSQTYQNIHVICKIPLFLHCVPLYFTVIELAIFSKIILQCSAQWLSSLGRRWQNCFKKFRRLFNGYVAYVWVAKEWKGMYAYMCTFPYLV